jgi:hypothetical protein
MEVKLRTLSISRKSLVALLALCVLVTVGIFAINFLSTNRPAPTPTPSVDDIQASSAVTAGVKAFFNVNYQEGKDAWLKRFCSTSSDAGCLFARSGSSALWKRYVDMKTVTTTEVTPLEKVKQTADEQVWRVSIKLSVPLPGSEKTTDEAYASAIREKAGWKFDRFLLDPEIQALKKLGKGNNQ